MAQPGVVLRRPVGSNKRFKEQSELPTAESLSEHFKRAAASHKKAATSRSINSDQDAQRDTVQELKREKVAKADEKAERKTAAAFAKEQRKRELQRRKNDVAAAQARARRHTAIERAKSNLENARRDHEKRIAVIEKDRAAIERRAKEEEVRWQTLESRLEAALKEASR